MKPIAVINCSNLNMLGLREPEIYGTATLADVEEVCRTTASSFDLDIEFHQSNHEGVIIDLIQEARERCSAIVLNPAGFTSTSIAILDALLASELPVIEVHLTNLHRREDWRHLSYPAKAATAVIGGAGLQSYEFAIRHLARLLGRD